MAREAQTGPGFSTRSWARSHRATKCHAEVQHLLITSDPFLTPHSQLLAQPFRATHVWIAALIGAPESCTLAGQADTHAFANATGLGFRFYDASDSPNELKVTDHHFTDSR
jgi:hypothetical protein